MNELLVALAMTVCMDAGSGGDVSCEEFTLAMWRGPDALALCRKAMEEEVEVWEVEGAVQSWKCEEI